MAYGLCSSYLPSGASMGKLVSAAVLGAIAFSVLLASALLRSQRPGPIVSLLRFAGLGLGALALALAVGSTMVVIDPGEVGVRHAYLARVDHDHRGADGEREGERPEPEPREP